MAGHQRVVPETASDPRDAGQGGDPPAGRAAGDRQFSAPQKFADRLADILRSEIAQGVFPQGSKLPTESRLAETFGVSRAVVREALSALRQEQIVESYQGKGVFVSARRPGRPFRLEPADLSKDTDLQHVLDMMIANDVAAASIAAVRRSDEQLAAIRAALDAMGEAIERDEPGIDEDIRFHRAIVAATGNPNFIAFHDFLEHEVRYLMRETRLTSARAGLTRMVQVEHQRIYEAIAAGDPEAARQAAETHLRQAGERLRKYRGTT